MKRVDVIKKVGNRVIFKWADKRSSNYYVREYFPLAEKYVTRSLRTEDLEIATKRAKHIDLEPKGINKSGTALHTYGYKFEKSTTVRSGQIAEIIFEDMMHNLNYEVCKPIIDCYGYDYILIKDGKNYKVQVKSTHRSNGGVVLTTKSGTPYKDLDIDYIAYINFEIEKLYFIPTNNLPDKLRLTFSELGNYSINFK